MISGINDPDDFIGHIRRDNELHPSAIQTFLRTKNDSDSRLFYCSRDTRQTSLQTGQQLIFPQYAKCFTVNVAVDFISHATAYLIAHAKTDDR